MDMVKDLLALKYKVLPNVYEPAEDSFMLAKYGSKLKGTILEIGCGSGFVCLTNALNNPKNIVLACDRSEDALRNAKENAELNNIKNVKFIKSNLFSKIPAQKFDHILFNPPYLPTSKEEKLKGNLNYAYDGGIDGRKTLDKFLEQFEKFLKPSGLLKPFHQRARPFQRVSSPDWLMNMVLPVFGT